MQVQQLQDAYEEKLLESEAAKEYATEGIAKACGCKQGDKCWPVLLSSKEGAAALELCPEPQAHGGIKSKKHTAPQGFSRKQMTEKHSEPATAEQKKEAGWKTLSNKAQKT